MKKLALLLTCILAFTSCDVEDDGPSIELAYAEILHAELPDSLELGETYEIKVSFKLPSACHNAYGIQAQRGAETGDERRDIYVAGVASFDPTLTQCNKTVPEEDLEVETSMKILIDQDDTYTFYLWTGVDVDGNSVYDIIEVPVTEVEPVEPDNGNGA